MDEARRTAVKTMGSKLPLVLMVVSLVTGCGTQPQYQQPLPQDEQVLYMNDTYEALNKSLEAEIKSDQVEVKQLKNRIQVTIADEILFPEGGWEVGPHGIDVLNKVSPSLQGLSGKRVAVQGFTDGLPVAAALRARFPTNWELSADRATNVVRHLQTLGVDPSTMVAEAFGQYHPIASNETPEGRRKNRRINIVIEDSDL
jgi:chemotaxis protein MotB